MKDDIARAQADYLAAMADGSDCWRDLDIKPIMAKDERTIDEMADDYTKRFLANLNRSRAAEEENG
jgi:hypothetical protein